MRIGELTKKTGVSKDTVRHYEEVGLLKEITRPNRYNDYKDYPPQTVHRIQFILQLKNIGFTLKEIKNIADIMESDDMNKEKGQQLLKDKLTNIDEKIEHLQKVRLQLATVIAKIDQSSHEDCNREINEQYKVRIE